MAEGLNKIEGLEEVERKINGTNTDEKIKSPELSLSTVTELLKGGRRIYTRLIELRDMAN